MLKECGIYKWPDSNTYYVIIKHIMSWTFFINIQMPNDVVSQSSILFKVKQYMQGAFFSQIRYTYQGKLNTDGYLGQITEEMSQFLIEKMYNSQTYKDWKDV